MFLLSYCYQLYEEIRLTGASQSYYVDWTVCIYHPECKEVTNTEVCKYTIYLNRSNITITIKLRLVVSYRDKQKN
jgi:hypothetical protein